MGGRDEDNLSRRFLLRILICVVLGGGCAVDGLATERDLQQAPRFILRRPAPRKTIHCVVTFLRGSTGFIRPMPGSICWTAR